jgi:hypothetical protein
MRQFAVFFRMVGDRHGRFQSQPFTIARLREVRHFCRLFRLIESQAARLGSSVDEQIERTMLRVRADHALEYQGDQK